MHAVYDKLLHSNVRIVGEIGSKEEYCLASKAQSEVEVLEVIGHPHICEECSEFLDTLDKKRETPIKRSAVHDRFVIAQ